MELCGALWRTEICITIISGHYAQGLTLLASHMMHVDKHTVVCITYMQHVAITSMTESYQVVQVSCRPSNIIHHSQQTVPRLSWILSLCPKCVDMVLILENNVKFFINPQMIIRTVAVYQSKYLKGENVLTLKTLAIYLS